MSLYPTKTRLALLQAVADGAVERRRAGSVSYDNWDDITRSPRHLTVTARMTELERAGWVRLAAPLRDRSGMQLPQLWNLTSAGLAILNDHGPFAEVTS